MAIVTWAGGKHKIIDAGVWSHDAPQAGDVAEVASGELIAVGLTLSGYSLSIQSALAANAPVLDLFQTTIAANATISTSDYPDLVAYSDLGYPRPPEIAASYATINAIGTNTTAGTIVAGAFAGGRAVFNIPVTTHLTINIADVTTSAGVVVQAGKLINDGSIFVDADAAVTINGATAYDRLINNGIISVGSGLVVNAPVTGTGVFDIYADQYSASGIVRFEKSVSAGQTINIGFSATLIIDDVGEFAGMIGSAQYGRIVLKGVQSTSATFDGSVLTILDNTKIVTRLHFSDPGLVADHFSVFNNLTGFYSGVDISYNVYGPDPFKSVTAGTPTGATPIAALPIVSYLPTTSAKPFILTTTAAAVTQSLLDGYGVWLEGAAANTAPSVNATSAGFGKHFTLTVAGQAATAGYGALTAIGYNANAGVIATQAGSGGGSATLAFDIADVTNPAGAVVMAGAFNNTGAIAAQAGTTITITGSATSKLINTGTLTADGMLFIGTAITGAGTITVGAGGHVEVQREVSTGQRVLLQHGTLTIDSATAFDATVFDFNPMDAIVLKGADVTSVKYVNGALLLDGGADGTLHFCRPAGVTFNTASFVLSHSGADTIITTHAHA